MIDEPYVLASQALQVFYVEDVRYKDWAVVVKTKPREVFDVSINASHNDDDEVSTYVKNVPYNITTDDACDDVNDNHAWAQVNEEGTIYDTLLISEDELLEQDSIDDEELSGVLSQATKSKTYTPKNICSSASKNRSHGEYLA